MTDDFVWPSDKARAENTELNRVCEYLEEVLDSAQGAEPVAFGIFYKGVFQEHGWSFDAANAIAAEDYAGLEEITVEPVYTHPQPAGDALGWTLVPPQSQETEEMVDAAVKVFEDAGVAVDLGWLGEACRAYVAAASATPQQSGEWMRCLCGSEPELEVYEPCDDHPGNACANWCVICECPKCGARPKPLGKRFSTEDEAYNAGKAQWKKFISGLTQPSKDKQEGDV